MNKGFDKILDRIENHWDEWEPHRQITNDYNSPTIVIVNTDYNWVISYRDTGEWKLVIPTGLSLDDEQQKTLTRTINHQVNNKPMITMDSTCRGFSVGEFTDCNGEKCSIQKSSAACESKIWLGIDEIIPKKLIRNKGWTPIDLPNVPDGQIDVSGRMHLNQEKAAAIVMLLQKFIQTGALE